MEIYDFLSEFGSFHTACSFNGSLMSYVETHDVLLKGLFQQMLEINEEVRVYENFQLKILHELISNKKIGYRDIVKVPQENCTIPYLLYWKKGEHSQCMLINTNSYVEARGMYYCLTEPGNVLEPYKYQILALCANGNNNNEVLKTFSILQNEKTVNAMIQRRLDDWNMADVDLMHERCVETAEKMFARVKEEIEGKPSKERAPFVYEVVIRAFLLKKALYVRYMSNKVILNDRHSGNNVEQRRFAKAYIDDIRIIPFYSLWNDQEDQKSMLFFLYFPLSNKWIIIVERGVVYE